jgi:hypothetical protein
MDKSAKPASPGSGATLPGGCQVAQQSPTRLRGLPPIVSELPYARPNRTSTKAGSPRGSRPATPAKTGNRCAETAPPNGRNGKPRGFREADLLESNKRDRRQMPRKDWKLLSRSKTRRFGVGGPSARGQRTANLRRSPCGGQSARGQFLVRADQLRRAVSTRCQLASAHRLSAPRGSSSDCRDR